MIIGLSHPLHSPDRDRGFMEGLCRTARQNFGLVATPVLQLVGNSQNTPYVDSKLGSGCKQILSLQKIAVQSHIFLMSLYFSSHFF